MTPEERASALQAELVEASRLSPRQVSWVWDDAVSEIIAAAIRDAEVETRRMQAERRYLAERTLRGDFAHRRSDLDPN